MQISPVIRQPGIGLIFVAVRSNEINLLLFYIFLTSPSPLPFKFFHPFIFALFFCISYGVFLIIILCEFRVIYVIAMHSLFLFPLFIADLNFVTKTDVLNNLNWKCASFSALSNLTAAYLSCLFYLFPWFLFFWFYCYWDEDHFNMTTKRGAKLTLFFCFLEVSALVEMTIFRQ